MAALEQERQGQWRLSRCPIQEMVVWGKQLEPAQFQETYLKQKNNEIPILQECILLSYQLCEGHHLIPFCLVVKIKKSQKHLASRPILSPPKILLFALHRSGSRPSLKGIFLRLLSCPPF